MRAILLMVLGVVLGYLFPYFVRFIAEIPDKTKSEICGEFYGYYCWLENENAKISKFFLNIAKKVFYRFDGQFCKYHAVFDDKVFRYDGKGYIENNYLCLEMKNSKSVALRDSTHHRYNLIPFNEKGYCLGLWFSTGAMGEISCGGTIISKKPISDDEIKNLFKKEYDWKHITKSNIPLLRLPH